MSPAEELAQLVRLCERLGAPPAQAAAMAAQLIKRCDQLATERGWSREQAMAHLLGLLVRGRNGETSPGFEGVRPTEAGGPAGCL